MSKTWEAATALSLGIGGSMLCWAAINMPTWTSRLFMASLGMGSVFAATKVHEKYQPAQNDYISAAQEIGGLFEKERQQFGAVMVEFIPEPIKIHDVAADDKWVAKSNRRWMLIFARPEKGKTQVALQKLEAVISGNPKGYRVQLVDFDYGKRGNTWGGFPKDAIIGAGEERTDDASKLKKSIKLIDEYHREMVKRAAIAAETEGGKQQDEFEPWFLGIDEGSSVVPAWPDTTREQLSELIRRGPGYNFSGFIIAQNPAVGELGLSQAVKSYLDKLCVRPDHTSQIGEFGLGAAAQGFVDRALDAEKEGKRGAIWHSDYGTEFVYIPDRTANPVQFATPERETDAWINRVDRDALSKALAEGVKRTPLWEMVAEKTGLSGQDAKQLTKNPYYDAFLKLLKQLESELKQLDAEPQTVEVEVELEAV